MHSRVCVCVCFVWTRPRIPADLPVLVFISLAQRTLFMCCCYAAAKTRAPHRASPFIPRVDGARACVASAVVWLRCRLKITQSRSARRQPQNSNATQRSHTIPGRPHIAGTRVSCTTRQTYCSHIIFMRTGLHKCMYI